MTKELFLFIFCIYYFSQQEKILVQRTENLAAKKEKNGLATKFILSIFFLASENFSPSPVQGNAP